MHWCCWCTDPVDALMLLMHWCTNATESILNIESHYTGVCPRWLNQYQDLLADLSIAICSSYSFPLIYSFFGIVFSGNFPFHFHHSIYNPDFDQYETDQSTLYIWWWLSESFVWPFEWNQLSFTIFFRKAFDFPEVARRRRRRWKNCKCPDEKRGWVCSGKQPQPAPSVTTSPGYHLHREKYTFE